jgi:lipoprotein-releasing system permease protein
MYKLLLCCRYLRTRYLALVCVVSVMLGVATLIVVNSVMAGFSTRLMDRVHRQLSDMTVSAPDLDGFPDPAEKMERIRKSSVGKYVEAMSPTLEVFALLQFQYRTLSGERIATKPVKLIGVDPKTRAEVGGFGEYLFDLDFRNPMAPVLSHREEPNFDLTREALARHNSRFLPPPPEKAPPMAQTDPNVPPPPAEWDDRPKKQLVGAFIGHALASFRDRTADPTQVRDCYMLAPGDMVDITTISGVAGDENGKLNGVRDHLLLTGYYKSEMADADSGQVFVPLDYLQNVRGMQDRASSILIRLTDYSHAEEVKRELEKLFPSHTYTVQTWEDQQGNLLAAIAIERGILNVLLFMIVGVAGFGILAIFSMIVVEKTRDIGILKALGASNRGVMGIFVGYGLLLGVVGAGLGTMAGLEITWNINEIEQWITAKTGQPIFNRSVYYFDSIPTMIQPMSVLLVNVGSVAIAVLFSVLPALRAAMLHPVRALRFE